MLIDGIQKLQLGLRNQSKLRHGLRNQSKLRYGLRNQSRQSIPGGNATCQEELTLIYLRYSNHNSSMFRIYLQNLSHFTPLR